MDQAGSKGSEEAPHHDSSRGEEASEVVLQNEWYDEEEIELELEPLGGAIQVKEDSGSHGYKRSIGERYLAWDGMLEMMQKDSGDGAGYHKERGDEGEGKSREQLMLLSLFGNKGESEEFTGLVQ